MMNKNSLIAFSLTMICCFALPMPAHAAEATGSETETAVDAGERTNVLTVGGADSSAAPVSDEVLASSGPGVASTQKNSDETFTDPRGASLGMFTTTGYCNCSKCNSGGFSLTYSGTVPTGNRTISADLDLYPIGTRLMIGDTIYIVEDKGTHVEGNWLDIYYDTHESAVAHGMKTEEVFAVIP